MKSNECNPLVSVIIPNYNHAKYLEDRIQSILKQTYDNYEIIILDDASTDNSLEIINEYRHNPKIACISVNDQNSGSPFPQWKKGISLAKGDLVWIAESDDLASNIFLEIMVRDFENPKIVLSYCKIQTFKFRNDVSLLSKNVIEDVVTLYSKKDFIKGNRLYSIPISNVSAVIFRRDVAKNHMDEIDEYRCCGDWLFYLKMSQAGIIARHTLPLDFFRDHDDNTSLQLGRNGIVSFENHRIYEWIMQNIGLSKIEKLSLIGYRIFENLYFAKYSDLNTRTRVLELWKKKTKYPELAVLIYRLNQKYMKFKSKE